MYFKKLVGNNIYLSPRGSEDYLKFTEWLNDMEVTKGLITSHMVYTAEAEKAYLENSISDKERAFGIIDKTEDKIIGTCGLIEIDFINRNAELGIFIGDKNYWGKGYGREAIDLTLDFGFNILNLNTIMLKVYEYNINAINCYKGIGFKEVGKLREFKLIAGKKYDVVIMDILSSEYKSKYIANKLIK